MKFVMNRENFIDQYMKNIPRESEDYDLMLEDALDIYYGLSETTRRDMAPSQAEFFIRNFQNSR